MHTYELIEHEWTVTVTAPTCTEGGYTLNECSCGNSYISNETAALGHDYTETTSGNDTIFTCSVCGHSYTQHTHNYSTTTVVAPTCTAKGYTLHVCACGHSYKTNETAALGHDFKLFVCTRCGYRQGSGGIILPPVQPPVDIMSLDANETELVDGCEQYRITSTTEVRHDYIYASGKLMRETITTTVDGTVTDTEVLDFFYDTNGRPYAFKYDGTVYYYVLNLQGDVIRIVNKSGTTIQSYSYNAWGEPTNTVSNKVGKANPLRYRGYYYDSELEMYYLQTRYYDPVTCRFINSDIPELAGADNTFLGLNLFAYCNNNPIINVDADGCLSNGWKLAITAGILVAAVAVIAVTGGVASGPVMCAAISAAQGAVTGAVSGAVSGAVTGAITGAIQHRVETGSWKGAGNAALNGAAQGAIDGAFNGAITGAISGAMNPTACFVVGTSIAAAVGYVAIETLKPGDLVWAWDEETGDVTLKPVKQVFVNESDELIHLTINGEEIITTPMHPFYVAQKGWFAAAKLRAGDILVLVNGEYVILEKIQHEILEAPITVYNFEVEDYHTYFVGDDGVLVHNSCHHNREWKNERRRFWRKQARTAQLNADYDSYVATASNIARMKRGSAPIGWDGFSVELHHVEGIANNFKNYVPVSKTLHDAIHTFLR